MIYADKWIDIILLKFDRLEIKCDYIKTKKDDTYTLKKNT